ncbi:Stk1 family PASTA domain-containing Ser/Thr kinase [Arthrobacter sp. H35-D1]|uniref:Stk1 family PASTA domain-containing Ser/Thr kinase n=1 Tax=Arthrobacter sp. H35-D1 TaxID=3046202 RepID=UPI0024BAE01A|nr:Stk1 family PASTA domain-containing Ser/Thr kinase [Arthrobacter sp. H35-D1]MDJ0312043.1 Stk1 family PASTA domain-containing Ser/Thr kinase [Arthrobacter sp. H35-D1]
MSVPRVLSDRYEIGELLGRGGMADVYKARDIRLGRSVAIKMLRADVARDSQLQARFRREAQAVAGLNNPFIVAVYDTGEHVVTNQGHDSSHVPYIVMEYVHGKTLRDLIRSKSLTIDQSVDYTLGVLSALDYSHRSGIVHRDIKPANVMVTEDEHGALGQVKVMDFGIARTISDSAATMTQTQTVMGTAQYLSPEQARGESVDARSDLYSAACLLYEMLAGRPPFIGDSPVSVAYQHVRENPPLPSIYNTELSPALDALLLRALQKDRAHRFQDAASFRRALRAARTGVMPTAAASPADCSPAAVAALAVSGPVAAPALLPLPAAEDATGPVQAVDDGGPSTRAMAKVLAGGALTTDDGGAEQAADVPPADNRRRRAWMITLFLGLVIVLGGGAMVGYNMLNAEPAAVVQVSIPSLDGSPQDEALTQLRNLDLEPHVTDEYSKSVAAGDVIRTQPGSGTMLNPGSAIELFVSKGPSQVTIPKDLAGKTESEVRDDLRALNLTFNNNELVNDGIIPATFVVTTDPAPGETVPVNSGITLRISTGQVLMPSLFDLTKDPDKVEEAVTAELKKVSPHLDVTFEEAENTVVTPGMVTNQSISAETAVAQHTTVVVTLAKAPEPAEPTPTPTPKPTKTAKASPSATPKETPAP